MVKYASALGDARLGGGHSSKQIRCLQTLESGWLVLEE